MKYSLIFLILISLSTVTIGQEWRPCGPGQIGNQLIPQGHAGADFRSACVRHDAQYDKHTMTRKQADRRFLNEMLGSCSNSSQPVRCRIVARFMYRVVRIVAGPAWRRK